MSCQRCDGAPQNPVIAQLLNDIATGQHACDVCPEMLKSALRVQHAAEILNGCIAVYGSTDSAPLDVLANIEQHYLDAAAFVGTAKRAREAVLSKEAVDGHRS